MLGLALGGLASALMLTAACTSTSAAPELLGTVWRLTAYSDGRGGMISVLPGTQPTATFQSTGFVTGSGGCNTYSTVYQSLADTLSITGPIKATGSLCEQAVMDQEAAYFGVLARTASYSLENGQLMLIQSGGAPLAKYE